MLGWAHARDAAGAELGRSILDKAFTVGASGAAEGTAEPLVYGRIGP